MVLVVNYASTIEGILPEYGINRHSGTFPKLAKYYAFEKQIKNIKYGCL